jgi:hypothetical protein
VKRKWKSRRELVERADGQRRWDRAYQLILLWGLTEAFEVQQAQAVPVQPDSLAQEVRHEGSCICTSVDIAPSATTDN